jgi:outer membrane murein-binding lipoprotein Lpp
MVDRNSLRLAVAVVLAGLVVAPGVVRAGEKGDNASPEVKQLQKQLQDLQDEVKALRERVNALESKKGFPFPPGGGPGGFPGFPGGKATKGTVKSFDKDKGTLVLTVAADSGIKVGQNLMAMKTVKPGRPLGMLEVKEVSGKEVTCLVKKFPFGGQGTTGTFEANEEVNLMPFPGFPGGRPPIFPPPGKQKE